MWDVDDLIIAPSTARAGAARAIVRIAGRGLDELLGRLLASWHEPGASASRPRLVAARLDDAALVAAFGPVPVDVLHWPDGSGPLGGPLAEIHLPGSLPLVDAVVARGIALGARLARGGEFTLRGFLARRIDLLQAEAVLAVVESRSPEELSAALDRLAGGIGRSLEAVRGSLLDLAGDIEATIDFGEDLGEEAVRDHERSVARRLEAAAEVLEGEAARLDRRGAGASERPRVVIVGPPNIGKSSLFNALVGRDAALVADEPGTTRDWVDARTSFGGIEFLLVDVAGVDAAMPGGEASSVDGAAMAVAMRQAAAADVLVACADASADPGPRIPHPRRIDVVTRCDRMPNGPVARSPAGDPAAVETSVVDGRGIDSLRGKIASLAAEVVGSPATQRLSEGVARAREAIAAAAAGLRAGDEAVVASHVTRAVAALGEVTGREIGTELLDRIFSRHCIGK